MPYTKVNAERLHLFRDNHAVLIYPGWVIITLLLTGFAVFGAIGFLGYFSDSSLFYPFAHPVCILFIWFCTMIILIQRMIFRNRDWAAVDRADTARNAGAEAGAADPADPADPAGVARDKMVRNWRLRTIIATLIFMICGIVVYAKPNIVYDLISGLTHAPGAQRTADVLFWNALNFGLLFFYFGDRVRLWLNTDRIRLANELAEERSAHARSRGSHIPASFWYLDKWELVSQDFFGAAALALALSVLLRDDILNSILAMLPFHNTGIHIDRCAVTLVVGTCQNGAAHNPQTLAGLDWSIGLVALVISLIILVVHLVPRSLDLVAQEAAPNVAVAVGKTLLAIFNPLDVFLRTIRVVVWPALIALGILLAALSAHFIRQYLHLLSDKQTCAGLRSCTDLHELGSYLSNSLDPRYFQEHTLSVEVILLAAALTTGAGAILAILASAQILVLGRVDKPVLLPNWLKFVGILGLIIICFFWILSLILSLTMYLIQSLNVTQRAPFPQPGISTMLSLAIFLALLIVALLPFRNNWGRELWEAMRSYLP